MLKYNRYEPSIAEIGYKAYKAYLIMHVSIYIDTIGYYYINIWNERNFRNPYTKRELIQYLEEKYNEFLFEIK